MTDEQIATAIINGLIDTGVESSFDGVSCSTAGDYPSMGCSQWEGLGGRGDNLLSYIDGGDYFAGRTYSDLRDTVDDEGVSDLDKLSKLLGSEQGQIAQKMILVSDCMDSYIPYLHGVPNFTNPLCIIYAGMWCPTSHVVVRAFLRNRAGGEYDLNNLEVLRDIFYDQYWIAADVGEACEEGYKNRAINIYDYIANNADAILNPA